MTEALAPATGPLLAAYRSDPGRVRGNNEDLPVVDAARGVYGVIDGVGGSAAGEVAAAIARDVILNRLSRPLGTPVERVREAIAIANNEIFRRAERAPELRGMTCVVTLSIVAGDRLTVGHVGDSRLYTMRPHGMCKLTHDHSPVGEREDAREISEMEAMHHPRRNELFRDVGGALHDKDEDDFVDVIEAEWGPECALLLCTDGLTDMVPSATIERIVRLHAGCPQQVVDALVDAANEAGGHDNVTVVYAEGAAFAAWAREGDRPAGWRTETAPILEQDAHAPPVTARAAIPAVGTVRRAVRQVGAFARWVVGSRTTWFAVGALAGVLATLALVWNVAPPVSPRPRTLVAGAATPGAFPQIAGALAAARPGDTVRLEPGVYDERIVVPEGVDLITRVPGTVTIRRPVAGIGLWVAVTLEGMQGGRLAGLRIESTPQAPVDVGIRVTGQGRTIEMVDVIGAVQSALELLPAGSVVLRGSVLEVPAVAVRLQEGAHATLTQNIVSRVGRTRVPPMSLAGSARLALSRNVLAGFGAVLVDGPGAAGQGDVSGNFVLGSPPKGAR
jgi:serine/threonine protein phosphatase PrpC